jgi:hypothetical protein
MISSGRGRHEKMLSISPEMVTEILAIQRK